MNAIEKVIDNIARKPVGYRIPSEHPRCEFLHVGGGALMAVPKGRGLPLWILPHLTISGTNRRAVQAASYRALKLGTFRKRSRTVDLSGWFRITLE